MLARHVCNLVVPGAAKSGTSTLHELLNLHPEICMSSTKEPHYFCRRDKFALGPSYHNSLFEVSAETKIYGESSTGYLPWAESIDLIIKELNDPRIIMLLREPVSRAFSHYRWRYRLGLEKRPFLRAIKEDGYGFNPERPDGFGYMSYIEFSKYSIHCTKWIEAFGERRCLILNSSDLKRSRHETLQSCFRFLGLSNVEIDKLPENANMTNRIGRRPSRGATYAASALPKALRATRLYKKARSGVLRLAARNPPYEMSQEEYRYLTSALKDDIAWFRIRFGE